MENEGILDETNFDARRSDPTNNTVSKGKRFGNYLIDVIITSILNAVINPFQIEVDPDTGGISNIGMSILVSTLMTVGYYFFMEGATGQTLGKMVTGTKVVDANGNKASLGNTLIRTLCRLIPFEAFSFFGPKTIGWHDSLSNTYVVPKDWEAEVGRDDILDA